jgi:hypothetical protein
MCLESRNKTGAIYGTASMASVEYMQARRRKKLKAVEDESTMEE